MPRPIRLGRLIAFTLLVGASVCPCAVGPGRRGGSPLRLHRRLLPAERREPRGDHVPPSARRRPWRRTTCRSSATRTRTRALLTLPAYNDSGSVEFFTVMGELERPQLHQRRGGPEGEADRRRLPRVHLPPPGHRPARPRRVPPVERPRHAQRLLQQQPAGPLGPHLRGLHGQGLQHGGRPQDAGRPGAEERPGPRRHAHHQQRERHRQPLQKGYITKQTRAQNAEAALRDLPGHQGPDRRRHRAGPVPRHHLKADGTPLEPFFLVDFLSLQQTGNWPH